MRREARSGKKGRQTERHGETDTEREKKRRRKIEGKANEKDDRVNKEEVQTDRDGTEKAKII